MAVISGDTLEGVSATTLWTLFYRSAEAKRSDGAIRDPMAVALFEAISYDYLKFGKPNQSHALRAVAFGFRCARDIKWPAGRGVFKLFAWPPFVSGPLSHIRPSATLLEFDR